MASPSILLQNMDYPTQPQQAEWIQKSQKIKERDGFCCRRCGKKETLLSLSTSDIWYFVGVNKRIGPLGEAILSIYSQYDWNQFQNDYQVPHLSIATCFYEKKGYLIIVTPNGPCLGSTLLLSGDAPDFNSLLISRILLVNGEDYFILHKKEEDLFSSFAPVFYFDKDSFTSLNTHHKYYVDGRRAWEYSDNELISLCSKCHSIVHQEAPVDYFTDESKTQKLDLTPCYRCGGTGYFPQWRHIESGICFRCWGMRFEELINK